MVHAKWLRFYLTNGKEAREVVGRGYGRKLLPVLGKIESTSSYFDVIRLP